jgi:hypothetical protein
MLLLSSGSSEYRCDQFAGLQRPTVHFGFVAKTAAVTETLVVVIADIIPKYFLKKRFSNYPTPSLALFLLLSDLLIHVFIFFMSLLLFLTSFVLSPFPHLFFSSSRPLSLASYFDTLFFFKLLFFILLLLSFSFISCFSSVSPSSFSD